MFEKTAYKMHTKFAWLLSIKLNGILRSQIKQQVTNVTISFI